ncbi:MAG: S8/S53 family peptidase, partial [Bacteroidota bacterium]
VWMMQSFPNAKTAELQNIYEIHFQNKQWNKDRLKTAFSNLNLFDKIEFANYYIADNQLKREGGHGYTNSILTSSCPEPLAPVNDLYVSNNWVNNDALNLIEANCAWTITKGDPSIVVGIADTEFDDNHEDLKNQIIHLSGNYTAPPECEHGTIVAGCVAAETNNSLGIAGIGYNTKIAGYKVYSYVWYDSNRNPRCGGNPWSGIWQAFQDERPIINVSWTGIGSPPNGVVAAAQEIVDGGTILVLGAGNSPNSNSHSSYANIPGVINVSGVDANNQHGPTGHAHNQWVDLCALSTNVTSTYRNDNYGGGWGTSFAAPQVAGVAALILSVNPCLTPAEVEDILKTTTEPISDASSYPNGLGTGRVNAYRAIEKAANLCIENQNITSNSDFESYILCTKNIDVQNNSELELRAVKQVNIFDSFTLQAGTKLEIFVDESYQINCQ